MLTRNSKGVSKNKVTRALMPRLLSDLYAHKKCLSANGDYIESNMDCLLPTGHVNISQDRVHCISACSFTFLNLFPCEN
jgi:hypothetical protein